MSRWVSAAGLCVAVLVGGLAIGLANSARDGALMAALLAATGTPALALSHFVARHRSRLGSLSRQFALAIGVGVGFSMLSVGLVAALMFVSTHDAFLLAVMLVFAGSLAAWSCSLVAHSMMEDVLAVRQGLMAVGDGERDVRIETRAHDELADLATASSRMIEQLTEGESSCGRAWGAQRDLIAAVSHDLRTPLASLQVLAEALEDDLVDDETRLRYLALLPVHIQSLGGLIDDLFELSRLQAGDIQWSIEQVRLDQLVEETVEAMQGQADVRHVSFRTDVSAELAPAHANPEKLQRVLFNLIQNALRHTPEDGTVTVAAEASATEVEVEVADTGVGIGEEDRDRVFEPFYRGGENQARGRSGAGLGLSVCRAIVEAHGGRIWLGETDSGTRVRFSLPRAA